MPVGQCLAQGASCIKKLKTCLRSTLKNDMLEALMHVAINGLDVSQSQSLIHRKKSEIPNLEQHRIISGFFIGISLESYLLTNIGKMI